MSNDFTAKTRDIGLLILRVGLGIMFVYHGAPKLSGGPPMWHTLGMATGFLGIHFLPTFWGFMAVCAELFGGMLLIFGLAVRPVGFILFIDMVVAAAMHLGMKQGMASASHAIEDGIVFLSLVLIGAGKLSFDQMIADRWNKKKAKTPSPHL